MFKEIKKAALVGVAALSAMVAQPKAVEANQVQTKVENIDIKNQIKLKENNIGFITDDAAEFFIQNKVTIKDKKVKLPDGRIIDLSGSKSGAHITKTPLTNPVVEIRLETDSLDSPYAMIREGGKITADTISGNTPDDEDYMNLEGK